MLAKERQYLVLEHLKANNIISISEIVRKFDVSHETARRDLEALKDQGLAKRIHGGAVLADDLSSGSFYYGDKDAYIMKWGNKL